MSIKTDSCEKCDFYEVDPISKHPVCRRYPPTAFQAVAQNPISGRHEQITGSMYPPIKNDGWCGEYRPKLAVAQ